MLLALAGLAFPLRGWAQDTTAPELVGFAIDTPVVDVTAPGAALRYSGSASDDLSGAVAVELRLRDPAGGIHEESTPVAAGGGFAGERPLYDLRPAGTWTIDELRVRDAASNELLLDPTALAGLGLPSSFEVTLADVQVAPAVLEFGDLAAGSAGAQRFSIANIGSADLTLSGLGFDSGAPAPFPMLLAPGESVDLAILFTPPGEGPATATLQVFSDDPDQPIAEALLRGNGVPADPTDELADVLPFLDAAVAGGTLSGTGDPASADARIDALRAMLESAGDLLDRGLNARACDALLDALQRTDGVFPAPDFAAGVDAPELATRVRDLRASLGCAVLCGDVDRGGDLGPGDVTRIRELLARDRPALAFERARCSVAGGPLDCSVLDAALLRREQAALAAPIDDVCQARSLEGAGP